jgi:hypothetical protein
MGFAIRMIGSVCGVGWDFYMVSFRKLGFRHQGDVCFLNVEKYFDFLNAWDEPVCIPRCVLYAWIILTVFWVRSGGDHERAHLFSLFGQDFFELYEGLLHYFD